MARKEIDPTIVEELTKGIAASENGNVDSTIYHAHLPEGQTEDTVKDLANYTSMFVAAHAKATGNVALERLQGDKKLEKVTSTAGIGALGDTSSTVFRTKDVTIPSPEKGGKPTVRTDIGVVRTSVDFSGGANSGLLKQARKDVQSTLAEALKK